MLQCFRRNAPRQHATDLSRPRFPIQLVNGCRGPPARFVLLNYVMMIAKSGDLGEMRHAQHLISTRKGFQSFAHTIGRGAADTGIDLIENERSSDLARRYARFQRERYAGQLAARGDLLHRTRRFPGVRRDQELNGIDTSR